MKRSWIAAILASILACVCIIGVDAQSDVAEASVRYSMTHDELVFRTPGPPGSARLVITFPWRDEIAELRARRDDGMWLVRFDVSDVPVMAELRYHWYGIPASGAPWKTDITAMDRPDPVSEVRFWDHVAGERVDVYGARINPVALRTIATAADDAILTIREILGPTARDVNARPRIVVVPSVVDYMMLGVDSGSTGIARPEYGVTVQHISHSVDYFADSIVPHEIMHLYDPTALRRDVPAWFTEGLAVLAEGSTERAARRRLLRQAARDETMIPMCWMGEYPRTEEEMLLWYAQAASMVEFLGDDDVQELLVGMQDGTRFVQVWHDVVGMAPEYWSDIYLVGHGVAPEWWRGAYLASFRRQWGLHVLCVVFIVCVLLLVYRSYLLRRKGGGL